MNEAIGVRSEESWDREKVRGGRRKKIGALCVRREGEEVVKGVRREERGAVRSCEWCVGGWLCGPL